MTTNLRKTIFSLATAMVATTLAGPTPAQEWFGELPQQSPAARRFHGMAFDAARSTTVLFGGIDERADQVFADTWTFDGTRWTQLATPHSPDPRARFGSCYDAQRARVLVFGGRDAQGNPLADTWSFDGRDWHRIDTPHAPTARDSVALAYDAGRDQVVLFGGRDADGLALDDTWTFDGTDWTRVLTPTAPTARHGHVATWLRPAHRVMLFGGFTPSASRYANDLWLFDGLTWTEHRTDALPTPMIFPSLSFNSDHDVAVLTGSSGAAGDKLRTFAFHGVQWHSGPEPIDVLFGRQGHATAYDASRGSLVLFGGASIGFGGAIPRDDTFELSTQASVQPFGSGCIATAERLQLDTFPGFDRPVVGEHIGFRAGPLPADTPCLLAIGLSRTSFAGTSLPLELDVLGLPGCVLLVSLEDTLPMGISQGEGLRGFDLPRDSRLLGSELFLQALVPGVATSNGLHVRIGN